MNFVLPGTFYTIRSDAQTCPQQLYCQTEGIAFYRLIFLRPNPVLNYIFQLLVDCHFLHLYFQVGTYSLNFSNFLVDFHNSRILLKHTLGYTGCPTENYCNPYITNYR